MGLKDEDVLPIRRALLSVSDKSGIVDVAKFLSGYDVEMWATGNTYRTLLSADLSVLPVEKEIGSPEILQGRVKTLHPALFGGILAERSAPGWNEELERVGGKPIDLVVCNLYPFEKVVREGGDVSLCVENIDIGGVTLLRAGAKNHRYVTVLSSPEDYRGLMEEMEHKEGGTSLLFRQKMALKAFSRTVDYDMAIHSYFSKYVIEEGMFPSRFFLGFDKVQDLRYGENPHQKAAFYSQKGEITGTTISRIRQLGGKELSFNNLLDLNDSLMLVSEFEEPTVTIVKHTNPCGVASAERVLDAFLLARKGDETASFGGIVASNRPIDRETAKHIRKVFLEAVIAPSYEEGAVEVLRRRKSLRIIACGDIIKPDSGYLDYRRVYGGLLLQSANLRTASREEMRIVAGPKEISERLWEDVVFSWKVVKHVKSNAIVVAKEKRTLGIGAGQMSRVDSVKIACDKAGEGAEGAVLASDAFFPFRDSIDYASKCGIGVVVEPGGSIRDEEVIAAAEEHGITLIFTDIRHFKH